MHPIQGSKIDIRFVHQIYSLRIRHNYIKNIAVVVLTVCDIDECRYTSSQVKHL